MIWLFLASMTCVAVSFLLLLRADRRLDEALAILERAKTNNEQALANLGRVHAAHEDIDARLERIKNGDLT